MYRKLMSLALACGVVVAVFHVGGARGGDSVAPVPTSRATTNASAVARLPAAVRKTALKEAGDHKIHGIEKESRKGKSCYAVEWTADGKEVEIWIDEDGTVVARKARKIVHQPRSKTRQELRSDMRKVLGLSDEQVRKIAALDEDLDKAAAKWRADNAAKVQEAQKALFSSRDKEAMLKAVRKLHELQTPYEAMVAKASADVQSVLTAAQQAKWQQHAVIDLSIDVWFARAKLTEAQRAAVQIAYAALAKAKDATVESIQVALADRVRDMLSDEQLKALSPFLMQTEWSFEMSTSGPAKVARGSAAKPSTSVNAGLLMLPAPKLLKNGVLALGGGYGGITGAQTSNRNTIVSPERGN